EQVVGNDLIDAFDEARNAGIVIEEPGGNYRFNHALVRQSLLAELASVRRMRLHQRIATTLEAMPGADSTRLPWPRFPPKRIRSNDAPTRPAVRRRR
ncbi:hypothetical protein, partial [Mycobacterium paraintracellulare]|uniref:hypothetical protein n=1 Tax=Mycobacterium paraintracellulare TaxID=1138383 RepID=UPI001F46C0D1